MTGISITVIKNAVRSGTEWGFCSGGTRVHTIHLKDL